MPRDRPLAAAAIAAASSDAEIAAANGEAASRTWVPLAAGAFAAAAPASFTAGALLNSSSNQLFVRVVPATGRGNSPSAAKLVLDHIAVTADCQLSAP